MADNFKYYWNSDNNRILIAYNDKIGFQYMIEDGPITTEFVNEEFTKSGVSLFLNAHELIEKKTHIKNEKNEVEAKRIIGQDILKHIQDKLIEKSKETEANEPTGANEPTEATEANEPTEATEANEPTEATGANEPTEATGANDSIQNNNNNNDTKLTRRVFKKKILERESQISNDTSNNDMISDDESESIKNNEIKDEYFEYGPYMLVYDLKSTKISQSKQLLNKSKDLKKIAMALLQKEYVKKLGTKEIDYILPLYQNNLSNANLRNSTFKLISYTLLDNDKLQVQFKIILLINGWIRTGKERPKQIAPAPAPAPASAPTSVEPTSVEPTSVEPAPTESVVTPAASRPTGPAPPVSEDIKHIKVGNCTIKLVGGSVLSYGSPTKLGQYAIVNAANEGGQGGDGVDGVIVKAGGKLLKQDRKLMCNGKGQKCIKTGSADITSNDKKYGTLNVSVVIHAVGPDYRKSGERSKNDKRLEKAYRKSMKLANNNNIIGIGFPLLSSGAFKGDRDLNDIINIGVKAIIEYCIEKTDLKLSEVYIYGFTPEEIAILKKINLDMIKEQIHEEIAPRDPSRRDPSPRVPSERLLLKSNRVRDDFAPFKDAQNGKYIGMPSLADAIDELQTYKRKGGHYIWYILPQISGIPEKLKVTSKPLNKFFSIKDLNEAIKYLQDDDLYNNYLNYVNELIKILRYKQEKGESPISLQSILDVLDTTKAISSFTLFIIAASKITDKKDEFFEKLKNLFRLLPQNENEFCNITIEILKEKEATTVSKGELFGRLISTSKREVLRST